MWLLDHVVTLYLALQRIAKTVFQSGCAIIFCIPTSSEWEFLLLHILTSTWWCQLFWSSAILIGVYWYLIVVLTYSSLLAYDVEHLSMCLFAVCMFSLVRCLFRSFAHFLSCFSYCWALRVLFMFWIPVLYQKCDLQIFSPSLWVIFDRMEGFNFNKIQLINYVFHRSCFCFYIKNLIAKLSIT